MLMSTPRPESALRHPLSAILGSEARIGVLRELASHGGELSSPQLVVRTRLAQSSVREALIRLVATGIIEALGSGKAVVYRGQKKHPLWPPLAALFHTESARFQKILDRTRDSLTNTFGRKIEAIWLFGSVVRNDDLFSSDMDIAVVFNTLPTNETMEKVRTALRQVEEELFVSIAAIGLTRADILRLDREAAPLLDSLKREAIALVGKRPTDLLTETKRASAAA